MAKLIKIETGEEVKEGDTIISFREEEWKFISVTRGGSRVYAKPEKGPFNREFYSGVFPGYTIEKD